MDSWEVDKLDKKIDQMKVNIEVIEPLIMFVLCLALVLAYVILVLNKEDK